MGEIISGRMYPMININVGMRRFMSSLMAFFLAEVEFVSIMFSIILSEIRLGIRETMIARKMIIKYARARFGKVDCDPIADDTIKDSPMSK